MERIILAITWLWDNKAVGIAILVIAISDVFTDVATVIAPQFLSDWVIVISISIILSATLTWFCKSTLPYIVGCNAETLKGAVTVWRGEKAVIENLFLPVIYRYLDDKEWYIYPKISIRVKRHSLVLKADDCQLKVFWEDGFWIRQETIELYPVKFQDVDGEIKKIDWIPLRAELKLRFVRLGRLVCLYYELVPVK
jgi:hypothetical protein